MEKDDILLSHSRDCMIEVEVVVVEESLTVAQQANFSVSEKCFLILEYNVGRG